MPIRLPDFNDLISGYAKTFVGREWLIERLSAVLEEPDCRIVVLTGAAGVGKTAFMAHIAAAHPDWLRYFIRRDSQMLLGPGDARTFLLTVGGQLAALRPDLFASDKVEIEVQQRGDIVARGGAATTAKIAEVRASPFFRIAIRVTQDFTRVEGKATALEIGLMITDDRQYSVDDLQYLGLVDPLKALAARDPTTRVVVLIDALDELRYSPTGSSQDIIQALVGMPDLGNLGNLRFVVSSRPEPDILDELLSRPEARHLPLEACDKENLSDLRAYTTAAVDELARLNALPPDTTAASFGDALTTKAGGNFLFLRSVLGPIRKAAEDPGRRDRLPELLNIDPLPEDLSALYRHFLRHIERWCEREFPKRTWRGYLAPLLGTLAIAREPLSESQLVAFSQLRGQDVLILLDELSQFVEVLPGAPRRYRIYHASFAQFLTDTEAAGARYLPPLALRHRPADLPDVILERVRAALAEMRDPAERDEALFELVSSLPPPHALELVEPAFALSDGDKQGAALALILPRLPPAGRADVLRRVLGRQESYGRRIG